MKLLIVAKQPPKLIIKDKTTPNQLGQWFLHGIKKRDGCWWV